MFITLEGIEGCGKTTLIQNLEPLLSQLGKKVLVTREPGASQLGSHIRPILLQTQAQPLSPEAELLLFLADRAEHVEKIIKPAIKENNIVLCDRYCHSTFAYQGYGRGLDLDSLFLLNSFACKNLMPDLILLLDLDPKIGLARANSRNSKNPVPEGKFEAESLAFHEKVRKGFLTMAENNSAFLLLDSTLSPKELTHQALKKIKELIKNKG